MCKQKIDENETFKEYLFNARIEFSKVAIQYNIRDYLKLRTAIDSFIIAYDQAVESATKRQIRVIPLNPKITFEDAVNAFLDWLQSDDCWVEDKNGKKLPDAVINGKNFSKYAKNYQ